MRAQHQRNLVSFVSRIQPHSSLSPAGESQREPEHAMSQIAAALCHTLFLGFSLIFTRLHSVLVVCRHKCVCPECQLCLQNCPMCRGPKKDTLHVYGSTSMPLKRHHFAEREREISEAPSSKTAAKAQKAVACETKHATSSKTTAKARKASNLNRAAEQVKDRARARESER